MGKIIIDTDKWQTQAQYAKKNKVSLGTLTVQVRRALLGIGEPKIEVKRIEELNLTLVKKKGKK